MLALLNTFWKSETVLATKSKKNFSKKWPIGPLRSKKFFFRFFRPSVVQNGRFQKTLEKKFFSTQKVTFSKKIFVHDNKRTILRWPWKFGPLGRKRSKEVKRSFRARITLIMCMKMSWRSKFDPIILIVPDWLTQQRTDWSKWSFRSPSIQIQKA